MVVDVGPAGQNDGAAALSYPPPWLMSSAVECSKYTTSFLGTHRILTFAIFDLLSSSRNVNNPPCVAFTLASVSMPTRWIRAFPKSTAVKALSEAVVRMSTTFLMTFSSSAGDEGSVTSTLTGCVGFSGRLSSGWGFAASPQTDTWFMGRSWCMRKCVGNLSSKPRKPSKFVLITAYVSGSSALQTSPNLADWALPPSCLMTLAKKSTYGFAEP